jgi:hypothetical protein
MAHQVLIWNAVDLERKLEEFRIYYNGNRVHQSRIAAVRSEPWVEGVPG